MLSLNKDAPFQQALMLLLGILALLPLFVLAQTPDPGQIRIDAREVLLQQERERALRERLEDRPDVRVDQVTEDFEYLPADEKPCFVIDEITLEGEHANRFQFALKAASTHKDPALGRCLGTRGISIVMRRVQNRIIERGYVTTRVLAAPQDLSSGRLVLTVIPGIVREVRFTDKTPAHRVTGWNVMPMQPGSILYLRDIEQTLENFKRLPTADASFEIVPAEGEGAHPGQSDIVIDWNQTKPVRFNASVDNSGSKYTGKYQGNATLSLDHAFHANDLLYFSYGHDLGGGRGEKQGTNSHVIHYEIPYKYWSLAFTSSKYNYHQTILGINENFIYRGTSENNQLRLSYLFYRDAVRKSTVWLSAWQRTSSNHIDDVEIELQRRRMAGWEFGLNYREFISTAILDAALSYKRGTGMFRSDRAPEEPFGEGTSRPEIILANLSLNMPFSFLEQNMRYTFQYRGQKNLTPLVPQDRFSIGNRYTVRGFDGEMVLMGDRGWLVRNDLGIAVPWARSEFYLGVDYGKVGGPATKYMSGNRHLSGAVIGIKGTHRGFYWDFFAGVPISKPDGFQTMNVVSGFNIGWSY